MSNAVAHLNAALADRYSIERELGEGGMATVYLAQDLKHNRPVAIKVLKPELAAVLGAERFLQEIETTAGLQHPNILPLFDSGEAGRFLYYVMPYVDGETLREKLDGERQLGVGEAVKIATEVAGALDYAHRQEVIHRDIKPENILLHDGRPLVADFGIALAVSAAGGGRLTETGLSLGTPHYMSPEQASADQDVTARSDVYSLGAVLYEMLAGQPPHTGPNAQSVLVQILAEDPRPVTDLRRTVPPNVAAAVARAIEKLPADRFTSAAAFAEALGTDSFRYGAVAARRAGRTHPHRARGLLALGGWVVAVGFAVATVWLATRAKTPAAATSFSFVIDTLEPRGDVHVTDDGTVVFTAGNEIRVRRPGDFGFTTVHTEDRIIGEIAVSPDGQWIAFATFGDNETAVYRIPAAGGSVSTLLRAAGVNGLVWGEDGWIYFRTGDILGRFPESGGPIDTVMAGSRFTPTDVLPGGRGLLLRRGGAIVALELDSRDTLTVAPVGRRARWAETGHVIYSTGTGTLQALPFSLRKFEVTGPARTVMDSVATSTDAFDVSRDGTLAYHRGAVGVSRYGRQDYWWQSLDGEAERIPINVIDGHTDGELSPDGTRIAYIRDSYVHVFDLDLGTDIELAPGHHDPVWSPDGREVAYRDDRQRGVWAAASDGSGKSRLLANLAATSPRQWLGDGTLIVSSFNGDVWVIDDDPETPPRDLFVANWSEYSPTISPDGQWIAYGSDEDGTPRAYIRSWPDLGGRTLVSGADTLTEDSPALEWSSDSRELYYVTASEDVVLASIDAAGGGQVRERTVVGRMGTSRWQDRDPGRNRFLVTRSALGAADPNALPVPNRLVVVTNWLARLRRTAGDR